MQLSDAAALKKFGSPDGALFRSFSSKVVARGISIDAHLFIYVRTLKGVELVAS